MTVKNVLKSILLFLLVVASPEGSAQYEYDSQFGGSGFTAGKFIDPRAVAVDNSGKLVITESGNHRVQICSDTGSCSEWGSFGEESGQFDRPRGVAVNSQGRIFVADRGNDRIQNCSSTGICTDFGGSGTAVGKFESPRGVAVTSDDRIVIADTDNDRIQICTDQGICTAFGGSGPSLGQFNSPAGVAVNSIGQIIIADRGNDRIQICSEAGSCTAFGKPGVAHGKFNLPWGVAVDDQDRIIVADLGNDRIQIFTKAASDFLINAGLNDAWVSEQAPLQGFFFTVYDQLGLFFLSWFTFDSEQPGGSDTAVFGAHDQRWVTASGFYSGDSVMLTVELTSGGVFNASEPLASQQINYGTITIKFNHCNEAVMSYDFPGPGLSGQMTLTRVLQSNVAMCESLSPP